MIPLYQYGIIYQIKNRKFKIAFIQIFIWQITDLSEHLHFTFY